MALTSKITEHIPSFRRQPEPPKPLPVAKLPVVRHGNEVGIKIGKAIVPHSISDDKPIKIEIDEVEVIVRFAKDGLLFLFNHPFSEFIKSGRKMVLYSANTPQQLRPGDAANEEIPPKKTVKLKFGDIASFQHVLDFDDPLYLNLQDDVSLKLYVSEENTTILESNMPVSEFHTTPKGTEVVLYYSRSNDQPPAGNEQNKPQNPGDINPSA